MQAFPKIFTIGQRWVKNIFDDEVEITEKIDGSQWGFGKIDGNLVCRSKGKIQEVDCPDKLFNQAIDHVKNIEDQLPNDIMFYGEYLQKNKHNVLSYERIPKNHIMLFGACKRDGEFISDYSRYAERLDLETVPILFKGRIDNFEQLKSLLQQESVLGKCKIEGFVVKNYNREILLGDRIIPLLSAKYVSEEFKEVHRKNWSRDNTGKGKWETFKSSYCTEARWLKALFYLRDTGVLDDSPKDIGNLMKRVNIDITEEEQDNIKDFLWKEFGKEVLRTATRGLPEWYKEYLAKNNLKENLMKVKVTCIQCSKCLDIIYSRSHHDCHFCSCGSVGIDGGFDYTRVLGDPERIFKKFIMGVSRQELYDDWNNRINKYGIIKNEKNLS